MWTFMKIEFELHKKMQKFIISRFNWKKMMTFKFSCELLWSSNLLKLQQKLSTTLKIQKFQSVLEYFSKVFRKCFIETKNYCKFYKRIQTLVSIDRLLDFTTSNLFYFLSKLKITDKKTCEIELRSEKVLKLDSSFYWSINKTA